MAYARRRGSYRRPMVRSTRRREHFTANAFGRFGLTTANASIVPIDLLTSYQNVSNRDAEKCTIKSVTGWITYFRADVSLTTTVDNRITFGIRPESTRVISQLDELTERSNTGPYDNTAQYDSWMWRASRPLTDVVLAEDTEDRQAYIHRVPVRTRFSRRLMALDDSVYLWCGIRGDAIGSGEDIEVRYDLTVHGVRP